MGISLSTKVFLWQAGVGDGVPHVRGRAVRVPHPALSHVRIHGQLHQQAKPHPREETHEQRAPEFYYFTGGS